MLEAHAPNCGDGRGIEFGLIKVVKSVMHGPQGSVCALTVWARNVQPVGGSGELETVTTDEPARGTGCGGGAEFTYLAALQPHNMSVQIIAIARCSLFSCDHRRPSGWPRFLP